MTQYLNIKTIHTVTVNLVNTLPDGGPNSLRRQLTKLCDQCHVIYWLDGTLRQEELCEPRIVWFAQMPVNVAYV